MAEKKEVKKGPPTDGAWKRYKISGDKIERLNKSCPKCGPGFLLAGHKDRLVCGACGYAEFTAKK